MPPAANKLHQSSTRLGWAAAGLPDGVLQDRHQPLPPRLQLLRWILVPARTQLVIPQVWHHPSGRQDLPWLHEFATISNAHIFVA